MTIPRKHTVFGEELTAAELAKLANVHLETMYKRLNDGIAPDVAVTMDPFQMVRSREIIEARAARPKRAYKKRKRKKIGITQEAIALGRYTVRVTSRHAGAWRVLIEDSVTKGSKTIRDPEWTCREDAEKEAVKWREAKRVAKQKRTLEPVHLQPGVMEALDEG